MCLCMQVEGAVDVSVGAKRVLHEVLLNTMLLYLCYACADAASSTRSVIPVLCLCRCCMRSSSTVVTCVSDLCVPILCRCCTHIVPMLRLCYACVCLAYPRCADCPCCTCVAVPGPLTCQVKLMSMGTTGNFINCEDGLEIPW